MQDTGHSPAHHQGNEWVEGCVRVRARARVYEMCVRARACACVGVRAWACVRACMRSRHASSCAHAARAMRTHSMRTVRSVSRRCVLKL
jgi:hypothetical protein